MPPRRSLDDRLQARLRELADLGLTRTPPTVAARHGLHYSLNGRPVVSFCSNDYLGLADEALSADMGPPFGAAASRLVCGDLPDHRSAETAFAQLAGYPDAVLFPSGFQLNVGVLPCLLDEGDRVHSDALNHASLIDGLRLSRATITVGPHGSAPTILSDGQGLSWWICESIYSMDGDAVPIASLAQHLAAGHCAYVDESHSFGLFDGGRGLMAHHDIHPTVLVVPLGKAVGCAGAFVAASTTVCSWIRSKSRSFVFSTGIAPPIARRIHSALDFLQTEEADRRRTNLRQNLALLAARLRLPSIPYSPIIPVIIGSNASTLAIAAALANDGFHVQPIRPPTVPDGTARLRITVSAAHTPDDIEGLADSLHRHVSTFTPS